RSKQHAGQDTRLVRERESALGTRRPSREKADERFALRNQRAQFDELVERVKALAARSQAIDRRHARVRRRARIATAADQWHLVGSESRGALTARVLVTQRFARRSALERRSR